MCPSRRVTHTPRALQTARASVRQYWYSIHGPHHQLGKVVMKIFAKVQFGEQSAGAVHHRSTASGVLALLVHEVSRAANRRGRVVRARDTYR